MGGGMLVEPLVVRIKGRNGGINDLHFAYGAMAAAGLDHDGGHRFDGEELAIEFDEGLAFGFEDEVNLGEGFVVVGPRILGNFYVMGRGGGVVGLDKSPLGHAAGAGHCFNIIEMREQVILHEQDCGIEIER